MTDAVLFDIDGTLIDSNYLHIEAWSHAFYDLGHAVDEWRIHRAIGMDSAKLLQALAPTIDADHAKERHSRYYEALAPRLRAFDGARELLRELADREVKVVLATSAPESELAILRGVLKIEDSLAAVTSDADVQTAKPAPDIVGVALKKAGSDATATVLVGDSVWDMESAGRAGALAIGVLSGGVSERELREAGAVEVYDDVRDLLARLDESALNAR